MISKLTLNAAITITLIFLTVQLAAAQSPNNRKSALPVVTPSTVLKEVIKRKIENPKISPSELADFGNEWIKKQGYNFSFYTCEIAEINNIKEEFSPDDKVRAFNYFFENLTGKKLAVQVMNNNFLHPCFCDFEIPLTKAGEEELKVIADGQPVKIKHQKKFNLEYTELVTGDLKNVLRTWYKPFEAVPFGISKDGTKIYHETGYDDENLKDLVLEIEADGDFKFVPRDNPNIISKFEYIEDFPKDPLNAYLGFLKFSDGKISYIIKVSFPCT